VNNREQRCAGVTELRVEVQDGGLPVIEGHAAIFNSLSQDLGFIFPFKEKIRSGAFAASLKRDDIRALWNHDPNYVLGRNRAGTLELSETDKGLKVRIHPPDTTWAKDLTESIKRGDVSQMSFGFTVEKETWDVENGDDVRTLEEVKLYDVSPVTFPAYLETDVGVRSVLDAYEQRKAEQAKCAREDAKRRAEFERLKTKFKV
jgi:HK97 family phage prohead protease